MNKSTRYKTAMDARTKFLALVRKEFGLEPDGAAGVYYSKKLKACIGVAGNHVSLEFKGSDFQGGCS